MATSLRRLRDLGESNARIAQLLDISATDVRKGLAPVAENSGEA